VDAEIAFEDLGDGDGAAGADDEGVLTVELAEYGAGGGEGGGGAVESVRQGGAGHGAEGGGDAGRGVLGELALGELRDCLGVLVGDEAASDFEVGLTGGDGFGAFALETAPDAVEVEGGPRPAALEGGVAGFAPEGFDAGFFAVFGFVEGDGGEFG